MIRRPPRSTLDRSSAASDVYKRQVNNGGESFPTEILSVCWNKKSPNPILVVNGFDRVSAPASFDSPEFSGFVNFVDEGVPDKYELGFTGCLLYTSPSPRDRTRSRMPSSA